MAEKRENKHAVIYFEPGSGAAMKDLAAEIRGQGGRTTLVWGARFRDANDIMPEARAVIVQKGVSNEEKIVEAYRKYGSDVEIHFVDNEGVGVSVEEGEDDGLVEDAATAEPVPAEEPAVEEDGSSDEDSAERAANDEPEDDASVEDAEDDASDAVVSSKD